MKRYKYSAKDLATNKNITGVIQADSEKGAGQLLVEQGYAPVKISEESAGAGNIISKITNRITGKDKIVFTRQFATLVGAGVPLADALRTVAEQTQNKAMKAVVEDILVNVEGGRSLSESFSKHDRVFDKVYISLISAGEVSGTLDESLKRIAFQKEKDAAMMSKIRGALTYPAIVLVVIFAVIFFMMFTVVPQIEGLYADMNQELPTLTAFMIAMTAFLQRFWWLVLGILALAIFFFVQWLRTKPGIRMSANFKLNVPIFKGLFRRLYMARFARIAQIMLASGVAMLDALRIASEATNNVVVQGIIDEASEKVKVGGKLSAALKDKDYILPLVPQMISIGEQSGKIDEMLGKAAQVYEDELDEQIRTISTMIEPLMMVMLAVVAGGMIAAILLPIYSLVNTV